MSKNNKIILILSIIGVIGIGVIIALLIIMNNKDEDDSTYQSESYFIDEVINFGKAAETKYVADAINGPEYGQAGVEGTDLNGNKTVCYTISQLIGTYVSESNNDYEGKVVLTISGDNISKKVTMTDGNYYYVVDANTSTRSINVYEYSYSSWKNVDSKCK